MSSKISLSDLNIEWQGVPSSNYSVGRSGEIPMAIVNHIMDGYKWGTKATFQNPANRVSTHFAVHWDGSIWQYVRVQDTAYGNGIIEDWDLSKPALAYCAKHKLNPNTVTISIEHEGRPGQIFPEAQIVSSLKLNAYLKATYGIQDANIFGHNSIEKYSRANCPGNSFFWTRLFSFVDNVIDIIKEVKAMASFQDNVTGKYVVEPFASAYIGLASSQFSSLEVAGRPLTGMTREGTKLIQDFERLRFEKDDASNKVQFALSNKLLHNL